MKAYEGVEVYISTFSLTSALAGGEWSASRPGRFTPGTHSIGGWVDPRAGLDDVEKRKFLILLGLELRPLGRPASSQSLYRLGYPGGLDAVESRIICSCWESNTDSSVVQPTAYSLYIQNDPGCKKKIIQID
jgi:hypothetical protein